MYLDPGFGSMVVQALIGTAAAAGSALYLFRSRLAAFFHKNKGGDAALQSSEEAAAADNGARSEEHTPAENPAARKTE